VQPNQAIPEVPDMSQSQYSGSNLLSIKKMGQSLKVAMKAKLKLGQSQGKSS
jgi:hypothetical protein